MPSIATMRQGYKALAAYSRAGHNEAGWERAKGLYGLLLDLSARDRLAARTEQRRRERAA